MRILHIYLCLMLVMPLYSQEVTQTPEEHDRKVDWIKEAGIYSTLFTGKEQMKYPITMENHPFYIQKESFAGSISYDGVDYPRVNLSWDTYKDELVAVSADKRYNIVLVPERLEVARFMEHTLYFLDAGSNPGLPADGYYLKLYDGDIKVWEKPIAALNEKPVDQKIIGYFTFLRRFYIQKENVFYQVKNRSSVLKALGGHKKELKAFSKENKLNFRTSPEVAIPETVRQYEKLTQTK